MNPRNRIFVFGSNLAGRHGRGAAFDALNDHGAILGRGHGHYGNSYAIPTRDKQIETLDLVVIENYVNIFVRYALDHPQLQFNVTRIGCGYAGYEDRDIAPLFYSAPMNCILPTEWVSCDKCHKMLDQIPPKEAVVQLENTWKTKLMLE